MKKSVFVMLLLLALALSLAACGSAKKKVQEKSAEKIAEELIKQSTGAQDVDIDLDNNSVSVTDENGSSMDVASGKKVDLKTFSAMGYQIPLPDGVVSGEVSRFTDDNGKETGVTGSFQTDGSQSRKKLFLALDKALTAQGLSFFNPFDEKVTKPDFSDPQAGAQYNYHDGKGVAFFFASYTDNQFIISGMESD